MVTCFIQKGNYQIAPAAAQCRALTYTPKFVSDFYKSRQRTVPNRGRKNMIHVMYLLPKEKSLHVQHNPILLNVTFPKLDVFMLSLANTVQNTYVYNNFTSKELKWRPVVSQKRMPFKKCWVYVKEILDAFLNLLYIHTPFPECRSMNDVTAWLKKQSVPSHIQHTILCAEYDLDDCFSNICRKRLRNSMRIS